MLRDLWHQLDTQAATSHCNDWHNRVIHMQLGPLKKVAKTIRERLDNARQLPHSNYCTHRITNAAAEGINSKITSMKWRVSGRRNRENFKAAIHFYCSGLSLYPRQTQMDGETCCPKAENFSTFFFRIILVAIADTDTTAEFHGSKLGSPTL